jgi:signal transduction histidine kinase
VIRGFNCSIRTTLIAISVAMLALILGLGALGFSRLYVVNEKASALRDLWLPATRDLAEVSRLTEHFRMISAVDVLATTDAERDNEDRLLANTLGDRVKAWNTYLRIPLTPDQRSLAQRIDEKWKAFLLKSDETLVLLHAAKYDEAHANFMATKELFVDLRLALADGIALNVREAARASESAAAEYGTARLWIGAALVLGVLVAVLGACVAIFHVSRPILRMADAMKRLAAQDLTAEIEGIGRRGEVGEMASALLVFKKNAVQLNEAHLALGAANERLEQRIDERTQELRAAQDELLKKERLSAIGQITATVAHELRNPLSAIRNSTFVLKELSATAGRAIERPVNRIERSIERCDRIVEELLDYTRGGKVNPEPRRLDQWLAELAGDLTRPQGGKIELDLRAGDARVRIDPERFRRVAINLVDNAVEAMVAAPREAPPRLVIRTRAEGGSAVIEIEDNGPGIPHAHLTRVFEPLFSTKSFGTGLGLPTVKQIVEQHDGTIELQSREGEGTRATIRLPQIRESIAA